MEDLCDIASDYTWGYRTPEGGTAMQPGWVHVNAAKDISISPFIPVLSTPLNHGCRGQCRRRKNSEKAAAILLWSTT